jgi:hypothetical protein
MSKDDEPPSVEPMTTPDVLKTMVAENSHIQVLRGPTGEFISVCRPNGRAMYVDLMTRDMLNDLLKAGLVRRDGVENERKVTIFRLTGDGKARA